MTATVVLLLVAQLLGAYLLPRTLHAATLWWSFAPAAAASLGADLLLTSVTDDRLLPLAGAIGLGLVAVLLSQIVRTDRTEVIEALAAGCGTLLATAPAAALIGLRSLPVGDRPLAAVVAAAVIGALPLPAGRVTAPVKLVVGTVVAALVCRHASLGHPYLSEPFDGVLVGLAASVTAVIGDRAQPPSYSRPVVSALLGITAGAIVGRGVFG